MHQLILVSAGGLADNAQAPKAVLFGQALAGTQLSLDLACRVGLLVVDALVADRVVDVEPGLADIDADVEHTIQLGNGRQFGSFHTELLSRIRHAHYTSLRVFVDTSEYPDEKPCLLPIA